jgi:5-amino-6-(5-phospho-D-ribitylamino)uracil phosphatase
MNHKPKIILTDLDNTLLKADKTISNYSIDIINQCKKQGILFGIATARSETEASIYIKRINPDIFISNGGAMVRYKDNIIYESMIPKQTSDNLLNDCMQCDDISDITIDTGEIYYWNYEDKST